MSELPVFYGPSKFWSPCLQGFPDPEQCPECTPPVQFRCPVVNPADGRVCRLLGRHRVHMDGRGSAWWQVEFKDDDSDEQVR